MYNLLVLLLMLCFCNIPFAESSYCNCVCPPLVGHTQQIPIQVQLIPHHPENQQLVIQQALSQHQVLQNIPRKTYAYISPYSQLENRELLNKILETQSDLRVKIRNEESSIHNEESLDSNQHNSVEHPPSTSTLHGVVNTKSEEKEEEDDGKSSDDHHHKKNVHYKFEYAVNDKHTGDIKNQKEERHGDVVRGEYSLVEADGNVRTVKYYADWKRGFFAQVHNSKRRH